MSSNATLKAAKAAGMISLMYLVCQILGFVRENLTGRLFDRFQTDAFFAAFIMPDTMYLLLMGGALAAGLIPIFTEYLTSGREEEGWKVVSTFINIAFLLLIGITILGMMFTKVLVPLEAPHFTAEKIQLLVNLTRTLLPAVCFTALAGVMGGVLNSYQRFFNPALGPIFYNLAIIFGATILGSRFGIQGMAFGVVIGAIVSFLIQAFGVKKLCGHYYRFGYIDLKSPEFRRMLWLMLPSLLGLSATQANLWATNIMASSLPEGSLTALRFANRLVQLPIGIFASGIAVAFFPLLSSQMAQKKLNDFKHTLALALRSIFFLMLPAAVGLVVLRVPIVGLLFQGQKFTRHDTYITAFALLFYSLAIFAHAALLLLPRAFYVLKDTRTPVFVSLASVVVSILLNMIFERYTHLGVGGFALSFSLMGLLNMSLLLFFLHRKLGLMKGVAIFTSFFKSLGAALTMGAAIWTLNGWLLSPALKRLHLSSALLVVVGMIVGGTVFFGVALFLKMEELEMVLKHFGIKKEKRDDQMIV